MSNRVRSIVKRSIPNFLIRRRLSTRITGSGRHLLLTLDDGPHGEITPAVLDRLERSKTQAMFFIVGNRAEKHPDLVRQIVRNGHLVGNHTYSHFNAGVPGYTGYRRDILRCQKIIRDITGVDPKYFRPARGNISLTGLLAAKSVGMRSLFWSLEGGEWGQNRNRKADFIGEQIVKNARNGDILLLHDDHTLTPDILDIILPAMRAKGFELNHGLNSLRE